MLLCLLILIIIHMYRHRNIELYHNILGIHIPDEHLVQYTYKGKTRAYCKHCGKSIEYNEDTESWEESEFKY